MRKSIKGWLITAVILIFIGCLLFAGIMTSLGWDFTQLSTKEYATNTYAITDVFTHVSISTETADITFQSSEDDAVSVICHEEVVLTHRVEVREDTLFIEREDTHRPWYDYIGIDFDTPTIVVCLPVGNYGDLTIRSDTGDVHIPIGVSFETMDVAVSTGDISSFSTVKGAVKMATSTGDILLKSLNADSLDLSVTTGDISIKNIDTKDLHLSVTTGDIAAYRVNCRNLMSAGTTGDVHLRDVLATDACSVERTTGDVMLDGCDAAQMRIVTDTGDVMGTLVTSKEFITKTNTGNVVIPHTAPSGGRCEITTDTGNIHIDIA